jgi:hypothetical protein
MMVTPFLFSDAIPVFDLPEPVFSGRQLPWSSREVKRLRDNSRCRFPPGHLFRGGQRLSTPEIANFIADFPAFRHSSPLN